MASEYQHFLPADFQLIRLPVDNAARLEDAMLPQIPHFKRNRNPECFQSLTIWGLLYSTLPPLCWSQTSASLINWIQIIHCTNYSHTGLEASWAESQKFCQTIRAKALPFSCRTKRCLICKVHRSLVMYRKPELSSLHRAPLESQLLQQELT